MASPTRTTPVTLLSISMLAVNAAQAAEQPAPAADESAGTGRFLEEVTVTARRREEALVDVPISVTVLSEAKMEAAGVARMDDLQYSTPAVQFRPTAGRRSNSTYEIRGIAANESLITQDPAVGLYVNDVYIARATGTNQSFYDIENVQVLYGPQGTLFGRNSPAGAVLVNTRKPTDTFEAEVNAGLGNFNRQEYGGVLNVPLGETFAARLAGQYGKYDGIGKDLTSGKDIANQDLWSARLSLLWNPSENFQNLTVLDYFDSKDNGSLNVLAGVVPCTPNPAAAGLTQFLTGTPPASCLYSPQVNAALGRGNLPAALATQDSRGPYTVAYDNPTFEDARARGASNTTTIKLSDALLIKNIIGYHDVNLLTRTDLDGANIKVIDTYLDSQVDQWSEELQLQGEYDRFNFVVGGLYFHEKGTDIQISTQLAGFNPTNPNYLNTTGTNTSYAVFAQGTYQLLDKLSITAGGRYTWDKREVLYDHPTSRYGQPTAVCQFSPAIAPGCVVELDKDFSDPSYTFSLEYKLADEILAYVATRQGYRSGGFNARAVNAVQLEPFDPETVTDYEVGFKGQFDLTDRVGAYANLAVYRTKYDDIQRVVALDPDGVGPIPQTTNTVNAAKATIDGFELTAGMSFSTWLEISGYWGYVDAVHDDFENDFTASNPVFNPSPTNPVQCGSTVVTAPGKTVCHDVGFGISKDTAGAVVSLSPFDSPEIGRITLTGTYSYRSSFYGLNTLPILEEFSKVPSQYNVNATLDWSDIFGSNFSAQAWVRNATDEQNVLANLSLGRSLGLADYVYADPRMYGLTLTYRFGE